jgi:hypothetical protein
MKTLIYQITLLIFLLTSCGDSGGGSNTVSTNPQNPENTNPIYYTVAPLPDADFFYWTESGKFYKCQDGVLSEFHMTAKVEQEGEPDKTINIFPKEFYKLGDYYFFEFEFDGETFLFRQLYGEIIEVSELMRHPDIVRKEMNNGRFSIVTNTWNEYTVSDIRNLTLGTGITRTHMCINYKIGSYGSYDYGLFFATLDDGLTLKTTGLYYFPETYGSVLTLINEPGEMW